MSLLGVLAPLIQPPPSGVLLAHLSLHLQPECLDQHSTNTWANTHRTPGPGGRQETPPGGGRGCGGCKPGLHAACGSRCTASRPPPKGDTRLDSGQQWWNEVSPPPAWAQRGCAIGGVAPPSPRVAELPVVPLLLLHLELGNGPPSSQEPHLFDILWVPL